MRCHGPSVWHFEGGWSGATLSQASARIAQFQERISAVLQIFSLKTDPLQERICATVLLPCLGGAFLGLVICGRHVVKIFDRFAPLKISGIFSNPEGNAPVTHPPAARCLVPLRPGFVVFARVFKSPKIVQILREEKQS